MTFKEATDLLAGCVTHEEIAAALGVSLASVRQARMDPLSNGYRDPPAGWEDVLSDLAAARGWELAKLAARIRPRVP